MKFVLTFCKIRFILRLKGANCKDCSEGEGIISGFIVYQSDNRLIFHIMNLPLPKITLLM